jgi:hypothetical protein
MALDGAGDGVYAFRGPAITLAGPVVGYAFDACAERCTTYVKAEDLSKTTFPGLRLAIRSAAPDGRVAKVGSLRVDRAGDLAWIICPEPAGGNADGQRVPTCVRAGHRDTVLRLHGGVLRTLDKGARIDPGSLRLTGERLSWIDAGRRSHAKL